MTTSRKPFHARPALAVLLAGLLGPAACADDYQLENASSEVIVSACDPATFTVWFQMKKAGAQSHLAAARQLVSVFVDGDQRHASAPGAYARAAESCVDDGHCSAWAWGYTTGTAGTTKHVKLLAALPGGFQASVGRPYDHDDLRSLVSCTNSIDNSTGQPITHNGGPACVIDNVSATFTEPSAAERGYSTATIQLCDRIADGWCAEDGVLASQSHSFGAPSTRFEPVSLEPGEDSYSVFATFSDVCAADADALAITTRSAKGDVLAQPSWSCQVEGDDYVCFVWATLEELAMGSLSESRYTSTVTFGDQTLAEATVGVQSLPLFSQACACPVFRSFVDGQPVRFAEDANHPHHECALAGTELERIESTGDEAPIYRCTAPEDWAWSYDTRSAWQCVDHCPEGA